MGFGYKFAAWVQLRSISNINLSILYPYYLYLYYKRKDKLLISIMECTDI